MKLNEIINVKKPFCKHRKNSINTNKIFSTPGTINYCLCYLNFNKQRTFHYLDCFYYNYCAICFEMNPYRFSVIAIKYEIFQKCVKPVCENII